MLTRLLTVLPLLLCPLLMLACMWAMRGARNRGAQERQARGRPQDLPTAARLAQLERELAELRRHLAQAGPAAVRGDPAQGSPTGTPKRSG
jgi:transposase-like protein